MFPSQPLPSHGGPGGPHMSHNYHNNRQTPPSMHNGGGGGRRHHNNNNRNGHHGNKLNSPHQNVTYSPGSTTSPGSLNQNQMKAKSFKNLYVGGLPAEAGDTDLHQLFSQFGAIRSAKVMLDVNTGESRGYGFVLYGKEEEGCAAFAGLNKKEAPVAGKTATLDIRASRHDGRQAAVESPAVYVRNLPVSVSEETLRTHFSQFGALETFVLRPQAGNEKGEKGDKTSPPSGEDTAEGGKSGGKLLLATIVYASIAAARQCIEATHNQKLFPDCALPVLAKFAESRQVKEQRKARLMAEEQATQNDTPQQQQQQSRGGPPGFPSTPPMPPQSQPLSTPPSNLPSSSGGQQQAQVYPNAVRLPLERRSGYQQIFFQGILGLTPDGVLYPIKPEICQYLPPPGSQIVVNPGPAWAGAPSGQTPAAAQPMVLQLGASPTGAGTAASAPQVENTSLVGGTTPTMPQAFVPVAMSPPGMANSAQMQQQQQIHLAASQQSQIGGQSAHGQQQPQQVMQPRQDDDDWDRLQISLQANGTEPMET